MSVNLGSLNTDRKACGNPGGAGDMQESVCESGMSVNVLSLRALRARVGGDHLSAQLWTNVSTLWKNLGPIWDP